MKNHIYMIYSNEINGFVIRMPEYITFEELKQWRKNFLVTLNKKQEHEKVALLIDTNKHQFESIECLELLRDLLSNEGIVKNCLFRIAFVQPRQYHEPEILNLYRGYFDRFKDAYSWLRKKPTEILYA